MEHTDVTNQTIILDSDGTIGSVTADDSYRSFVGYLKLLQSGNDFVCDITIDCISDEVCRNDWQFINIERHIDSFVGKPLLVAYTNAGARVGDGHNFRIKKDKNGNEYASFTDATAERIVGVTSFSKDDVRIENRNGVNWVVASGVVYEWYAHELVEKLSSQGGKMEISIEAHVTKQHNEGTTEVFEEYTILGITILGDGVEPAFEGANIRTLSDINGEIEELKVKVAEYKNKNPQTKTTKELTKHVSKIYLAELQERFAEHTVIGATEDGLNVCLLSHKGIPCTYTFGSADEKTVVKERITNIPMCAKVAFESGAEVEIDVVEVMLNASKANVTKVAELETKLADAETRATNAEGECTKMRNAENIRRVEAAKLCVKDHFAKINSVRKDGEKLEDSICAEIYASADAGKYTNLCDESGKWIGDAQAVSDLRAKCMEKVEEITTRLATADKDKHTFAWNNVKENNAPVDKGVSGLIGRIIEN